MKKLLFILLMAMAFLISNETKAQGPINYTYFTIDTMVNAGTIYAYLNTNTAGTATAYSDGIKGKYEDLGAQVLLTRISDTASGTVTLQVSNDGTTWATCPGTSAYTVTNSASQNTLFDIGQIKYKRYRLALTSVNTGRVKVSGKFSVREK